MKEHRPVSADDDNPAVCNGTHITPPANTTEVTVTATEGKLISGYCVKSGSINQDLGPEYVTLAEPLATVTIKYTKTTDVKDISHYVVTYVGVVVPEEATPVTPMMPTLATPPSCEAEGVVEVLADTDAYTYDYVTAEGVTTVTVTAKAGHVLVGDVGPWTFPIAQLTGEGCETEVASNSPPASPVTPVAPTAVPTVDPPRSFRFRRRERSPVRGSRAPEYRVRLRRVPHRRTRP